MVIQVQVVNVPGQPCAEGNRDLGLQELDHGIRVRRKGAYAQPLEYAPKECLAIARDQIPHQLSIEARDDEREVRPQHQEDTMTYEKSALFAVPPRYHDIEETQKLVEEGQIEPWLRLRRGSLRVACVRHARGAGRLEEQSPMRIKGRRLRRIDDHFRRGVAIRHVYRPRAIFAPQARVPPEQPPACFLFCSSLLVKSPSSIAGAYDCEGECDGGDELRELRRLADAGADNGGIVPVELKERIMRLSQRGLSGHRGPWTSSSRGLSCLEVGSVRCEVWHVQSACLAWDDARILVPRHVKARDTTSIAITKEDGTLVSQH
jgi:hypothetical protein